MRHRGKLVFLLLPIIITAGFFLLPDVRPAAAQDDGGDGIPDDGKNDLDQRCLGCHAGSEHETTFLNGDTKPVAVDIHAFNASQHGSTNPEGWLSCFDCHGDYTFPHEGEWESAREFRLDINQRCESCHSAQSENYDDSVHALAQAQGNKEAATCVDCHGYHTVEEPGASRAAISRTCGRCHTSTFIVYSDSIHGSALLDEGNTDVPTCTNCHGVHTIETPTTATFRLRSPELCAQCHADEELMAKYDISTNVFDSYIDDFHGTTVTLFEHEELGQETNKAVCYDCHGVHNIRASDDTQSTVYKENLLDTCQKCHPDATTSFPDSWLGHYEPDAEKHQIVYFVDLFYKFFIPGVLGGMLGLIILPDAYRRIFRRDAGHH